MSAAAPPKLFISYRREETAGHAGRLYDAIASDVRDYLFVAVQAAAIVAAALALLAWRGLIGRRAR